jgi:thiol-disulfide isomerase/thioredoxin
LFKLLIFSLLTFTFSVFSYSQSYKNLKKGNWKANLSLDIETFLPFKLEISGSKKSPVFTIHNAEEKIQLSSIKKINDSLQVDFPNFHSFLRFKLVDKETIHGNWHNLNKGVNYKIPFSAKLNNEKLKEIPKDLPLDLSGRWKTFFSPNTKNEEIAIGVFSSNSNHLTGTFLTETGDYRFLEGETDRDNMFLSCFDGSHAFFFEAYIKNDSLKGKFYSGSHYTTDWIATKDENFTLRNPDSLTYLVKTEDFKFKVKDLENKDFTFSSENYKNKVCIIQIMGTWCPNCIDETRFLKEMYEKYHEKGLEIISVCYESPSVYEEQVQKVNLMKKRLNLDFTFLIGGQANKALASEHFSMLNQIISYPTAIFLDKNGRVVKIHTGFNGPGTGEIYTEFVKETEELIMSLLK